MSAHVPLVLIVEDDRSIRQVLGCLLRLAGYDVVECADGTEALTVVERHAAAIRLMIADYRLPGINGIALAREISRTAPWIRSVIVSGRHTSARECRATGLTFLAKPFGTADVLRAIGKLQGLSTEARTRRTSEAVRSKLSRKKVVALDRRNALFVRC